MTSYLICATQRSGSTLVCELLAQTGIAGRPNEYLLLWLQRAGEHDPDFWRTAVQQTVLAARTDNGAQGFKVMADHFRDAMALLRRVPEVRDLGDWQIAERAFEDPRVVRVRRRDRVRQAVSLYIANTTGVYHLAEPGHGDNELLGQALEARDEGYNREVPFDFDAMHRELLGIERQERYWDETLSQASPPALEIRYEDFVRDQEGHLRRILTHIGVGAPATLSLAPHMRRMSNDVNERFAERFRRVAAERGISLPGDGARG